MAAYTPQSFAVAVLKRIGAPVTPENVRAMVGWEKAEGGNWHNDARFNPLNTTQPMRGAGNTGSQGNIKVYRSPRQGIRATAKTLKNGNYGPILAAFQRGNSAEAVARAIGQTPWGTSGGLVAQTIAGTAAPKHIGNGFTGGGGTGGTPGTRTVTETTSITPEAQAGRRAALAQFVLSGGDPLTVAQNYAALGNQTQTTRTVTVHPSTTGGDNATLHVTGVKGTAMFEGKRVAGWIAPILRYARQHGWQGHVNSGFRSFADQQRIYNSGVRPAARPGTSNHEGANYPRGAVDVSDAQQLSNILRNSPYRNRLVYAGAKDPVHFSHPHNGSY